MSGLMANLSEEAFDGCNCADATAYGAIQGAVFALIRDLTGQ